MADEQHNPQPWWRIGQVWLVIAGPLVVVVASLVTFYLAVRAPDPVIEEDYYRKGLEIGKTLNPGQSTGMAPALQARNHAQTGVPPQVTAPAGSRP